MQLVASFKNNMSNIQTIIYSLLKQPTHFVFDPKRLLANWVVDWIMKSNKIIITGTIVLSMYTNFMML
jgi:hypothetical protein